ncbi:MAG: hypothetical protein N2257_00010 [Thermodesulfovibrionales bacterium]|nr:hypothetical protein [Thermodesulfovibrionales bacterium]
MIYSKTRNVLKWYEWILLIAIIIGGLFTVIWLRSAITALEYNIAKLEETKIELLSVRKELLAERATLSSVKRIETIASSRGLTIPDRRYIHFKKRNESVEVVTVSGTLRLDELLFNK